MAAKAGTGEQGTCVTRISRFSQDLLPLALGERLVNLPLLSGFDCGERASHGVQFPECGLYCRGISVPAASVHCVVSWPCSCVPEEQFKALAVPIDRQIGTLPASVHPPIQRSSVVKITINVQTDSSGLKLVPSVFDQRAPVFAAEQVAVLHLPEGRPGIPQRFQAIAPFPAFTRSRAIRNGETGKRRPW